MEKGGNIMVVIHSVTSLVPVLYKGHPHPTCKDFTSKALLGKHFIRERQLNLFPTATILIFCYQQCT
jgi:hypothetical protein